MVIGGFPQDKTPYNAKARDHHSLTLSLVQIGCLPILTSA